MNILHKYIYIYIKPVGLAVILNLKWKIIAGKTCENQISPNDNYNIMYVSMYVSICVYMYALLQTCDIQTRGYIAINKKTYKKLKKDIHSGGRWKLTSSAEPEQK